MLLCSILCVASFVALTEATKDSLLSYPSAVSSRIRTRVAPPLYNLTFLHVNDVHAHLDQYRPTGTDCDPVSPTCVGGYARIKTKVDEIRAVNNDNTLLLNMGDEFQGTLFFGYYGGAKIAQTVNSLGFDAGTIGNHEFDNGDNHLAAYLRNVTFPIVSANIKTNNTALAARIKPYHIFPKHSLAVIGLTTIHTKTTSSPGAGTQFLDPVEIIQRTVDYIEAHENVSRIVAMTHIGYAEDIDLAARTRGIHLILGGHSHTLLGNFSDSLGPYPTIQKNLDGEEVFIVTAWRWGQVLGYINVSFEDVHNGRVVAYSGGPIEMTNDIPQDKALQAKVDAWRKPFDDFSKEVVGYTQDVLDATACQFGECTMGNLICDSILDYRLDTGGKVDLAIMNAGGIRASIPAGNVTRGQISTSFPFGNAVVDLEFTGAQLWELFEGVVSWQNSAGREVTSFIQVSRGFRFTYNPKAPIGTRLRSLVLLRSRHSNSMREEPVQMDKMYVVSTIDFIANGGDGFLSVPRKEGEEWVSLEALDVVLARYIKSVSPYRPFVEGRVQRVDEFGGRFGRAQRVLGKGEEHKARKRVGGRCWGARCPSWTDDWE